MAASTEVKQEAKELGIAFSPNISENKLKDKIEAYYASKEEPIEAVAEVEDTTEKPTSPTKGKKKRTLQDIIKQSKEEASAVSIITVVDNDQRVNNQTTTCVVNCSNEHFDLGTRVIPLNERVEVEKGFIDTLREIRIPQHTKDPKTGLSRTVMRPRYAVSIG
jgi:hypothetical protein